SLSYLFSNGFADYPQALVTEMLGLTSIYSLEGSQLNPLEKVKSYQPLVEFFQEFLDEFDTLEMIGFIQSMNSPEKKPLNSFVKDNFPYAIFRQDIASPFMSVLFGPRVMGIFVVENDTSGAIA
ncbi:MAG: hypothetical protein HPY76_14470, partial [Anaerolineae bacterium]|nr:hypothetical protein [Anaerolineae bacterium]